MNTKVNDGFDILMGGGKSTQNGPGQQPSLQTSNVAKGHQAPSDGYDVTFKMPYKTEPGQSLAIVGNI